MMASYDYHKLFFFNHSEVYIVNINDPNLLEKRAN